MTVCDWLPTCPFFDDRMQGMDDTAELVKDGLCRGDYEACARYQVARTIGRKCVPPDLYPTQLSRVKEIICAGQRK